MKSQQRAEGLFTSKNSSYTDVSSDTWQKKEYPIIIDVHKN